MKPLSALNDNSKSFCHTEYIPLLHSLSPASLPLGTMGSRMLLDDAMDAADADSSEDDFLLTASTNPMVFHDMVSPARTVMACMRGCALTGDHACGDLHLHGR